jgi:DNA repair photolyase
MKGRGAAYNPKNRFLKEEVEWDEGFEPGSEEKVRTKFIDIFPKTIINKVPSPDIPSDFSVNPYQGCEHGCSYCYARPSHEYWGYGSGLEFESVILVKRNAPQLLREAFNKKSWKGGSLMMSGNTDCYQPAERKFEITRQMLKVCSEYNNPVGIITKNNMVLRDIDILAPMAQKKLAMVNISLNTLQEDFRRKLEPRTATVEGRLRAIEELTKAGIPVNVLMAPLIPGINGHEVLPLMEEVARRGAVSAGYIILRLNGPLQEMFAKWLETHYPDRKDKVINQVSAAHGGQLNDSRFGTRMKGEGKLVEQINQSYHIGKRKLFNNNDMIELTSSLFERPSAQTRLF